MNYYVRRITQAFVTVFSVMTLSFVMVRLLPGGPVAYLQSQYVGSQDMEVSQYRELMELYVNIDLTKPLWQQYLDYLWALAHGDLGMSIWFNRPVAAILGEALPWTVLIMSVALTLNFLIGLSLGSVMAYKEGSRFDYVMTSAAMVFTSIPFYIAALLLVFVFAYQLGWFPIGGRMTDTTTPGFNYPFFAGMLEHAFLPILSVVVIRFWGRALGMRGNSIQVLGEDFLRVARLRGLSERFIAINYVARNAILPMYTGLLISIGRIFGGAVILESIFMYPGVGYYMFRAVQTRDYPLMLGAFLIITVAVVTAMVVADTTYSKLDPRVKRDSESAESYLSGLSLRSLLAKSPRALVRGTHRAVAGIRAIPGRLRNRDDVDDEVNDDFQAAATEGVETGDTPFDTVAETQLSRYDRLSRVVDEFVVAPAKILWNDSRARIGLLIILLFALMGTVGIAVVQSPHQNFSKRLLSPATTVPAFFTALVGGNFGQASELVPYLLGTDDRGQSILRLIVHATPPMLKMMAAGGIITVVIASTVGIVSGYVGGKLDSFLMSVADMIMTLPGIPLMILISVWFQPESPWMVGLILAIDDWGALARALRSQTLTLRDDVYIEASRILGLSTATIFFKDMLPNLMPYITVRFVGACRRVIFASIGLYFLGILPFTSLNWGVMMNFAHRRGALQSMQQIHWLVVPMVVVVLISWGLMLFGQSMDRIFNPRVRARHEKTASTEEESASPTVEGVTN